MYVGAKNNNFKIFCSFKIHTIVSDDMIENKNYLEHPIQRPGNVQ